MKVNEPPAVHSVPVKSLRRMVYMCRYNRTNLNHMVLI